jgi:hypothetical protein
MGDRILSVNGADIRKASHQVSFAEKAEKTYKKWFSNHFL